MTFLLQLSSFTVDSDPLQPTGCVDRYTSHVIFLMRFTPHNWRAHSLHGSSDCVARTHSIFMPSMMSVWSSVRCPSLRVCPSLVSLCCLPLLFLILPVLWLALLLPCGQRQGKHPLRLRPMRSIAPWRYTILPQTTLVVPNATLLHWADGSPYSLQLWGTGPWCGLTTLQGRQDAALPYAVSLLHCTQGR